MNQQTDLISVVIPCYNDGMYITETVEKTKAQTYKNIEIIIVNDGSTDAHTIKTLDALHLQDGVTVLHKENGKMSSARNYGVAHAKGRYIVTLDADDYFEKTFFSIAKNLLDTHDNYVAVSCYMKNFGLNKKKFKPRGGNVYNFLFSNQCPSCAMLKKTDWDLVNGYDEEMVLGYEDWEFYLRLTAKTNKEVHIIPKYLYNYRQTSESTLKNISDPNASTIIDYIVNKHPELYLECLKKLILEKEVLYTESRISWQNIINMIKNRLTAKYDG